MIVGVALLALGLGCGGLALFVYFRVTSCVGEMNEPIETVVGELSCDAGGTVSVVNRRTTTNWLEGVYRNRALLRVSKGGEAIDVEVSEERFRDYLPDRHRPPHRIDGDPTGAGFEVYLDPATVPAAEADAIEACLLGRADEVVAVLRSTDAHGIPPEPGTPQGVVYWRASEDALEPVFRAPSGETIALVDGGALWLDGGAMGTHVGEAARGADGVLRVTVDYSEWGVGLSTPVSDFRDPSGQTLEAWFGVPLTLGPGTPP